jgi:uncharacterized membrane protein
MLPDPLHPAIVHLPIALALLVPLLATCCGLAIRMGWLPRQAWSGVVLLCFVLVAGSWLAMETGEVDEEPVERVVAERFIEAHEEAAEVFMVLGVVIAVVALLGLRAGAVGNLAHLAVVMLSFGLLVAGARVGHLGGMLVYQHGAASAHAARSSPAGTEQDGVPGIQYELAEREADDHEEEDDD